MLTFSSLGELPIASIPGPSVSARIGWFEEWGDPKPYYSWEQIEAAWRGEKGKPSKQIAEESEANAEEEAENQRNSEASRYNRAYQLVLARAREVKGTKGETELREFLALVAPYRNRDDIDREPLIEGLNIAAKAKSVREIYNISERLRRVIPMLRRS